MSGCSCGDDTARVRVSDEGFARRDGRDMARLRCVECGGKAGWMPADALEAFGFDRDAVEESVEPGPRQIYLTVRTRWDTPPAVRSDGGTRDDDGDSMNLLKSQIRASQAAILGTALARWEPPTGVDPEVTRAQTRRAAEHLAATGHPLGRTDLVDALADGATLDTATWWGRAVNPGLRYLAEEGIVEYRAADDTYRWTAEGGT